jgi:hypothetical protein
VGHLARVPSDDFDERKQESSFNWWLAYRTSNGTAARLQVMAINKKRKISDIVVRAPIPVDRWETDPKYRDTSYPLYPAAYVYLGLRPYENKAMPGVGMIGDLQVDLFSRSPRGTNKVGDAYGDLLLRGDLGQRVSLTFFKDRGEHQALLWYAAPDGNVFNGGSPRGPRLTFGQDGVRNAWTIFERVSAMIQAERIARSLRISTARPERGRVTS